MFMFLPLFCYMAGRSALLKLIKGQSWFSFIAITYIISTELLKCGALDLSQV